MKKANLLLAGIFVVSIMSSCGSSPYKKRKGCRGNGSWSGNRNLGAIDQKQKDLSKENTYAWTKEEKAIEQL